MIGNKVSITKKFVDSLVYQESGSNIYFDKDMPGFGVRLYRTSKTFVVQAWVNGKSMRRTVGKYGHLTVKQAQDKAQVLLGIMSDKRDPKAVEIENKLRSTTLAQVFEDYKSKRQLRPATLAIYEGAMRRCLPDWQDKTITSFTRDQIEKRLQQISTTSGPRGRGAGKAQAGQCYRLLRSLFKFAAEEYEASGKPIIDVDPLRNLSRQRPWTEHTRRQSVIQKHQLKDWFQAVLALENRTARDLFILCILTGLRRSEALSLTWSNIDFQGNYLRIGADTTKNHQEHRLPLSDYLHDMLSKRLHEYQLRSIYVFPNETTAEHVQEPKRQIKKVIKASGVKFMLHDCRRTFLTVAESLDISHYTLKKLVNHKTGNDITGGYIVSTVERLRQPMQRITDYILEQAGIRTANTEIAPIEQELSVNHLAV